MGSGGWSPTDMHWCCSFHVAADTSDLCLYLYLVTLGRVFWVERKCHAYTLNVPSLINGVSVLCICRTVKTMHLGLMSKK